MWVHDTERARKNSTGLRMLSDAVDPSGSAGIGTLTVECDTEGIIYVCWAVKADGNSRVRTETKLEQIVVDESAIRLNGTTANGG